MSPRWSALGPALAIAGLVLSFSVHPLTAATTPPGGFDSLTRARALGVTSVAGGAPVVSLFIEGPVSDFDLESRGATVGPALLNGVRTVRVPLDRLDELAATPGLTRISASSRCRPFNNLSVPATGATPGFWTSPVGGDFGGNAGGGVIIGVVDTGIDWTHDDFKRPNGTTRILSIWDQRASGTPPTGFGYGVEWSAAQVNSGSCTHQDTNGHGTHVAGSAAGDGSATGAGLPALRFPGMAPEADLIVVATDFQTASIVDGANYVFQRAAALGKSAVVLVTAGTQFGPHDGSSVFDTSLDALTGPGKILVTAAGNAGGAARHAEQPLSPGGPQTITLNVPAYVARSGADNDFIQIESYYDAAAAISVTLTSPGPAPVVVGPVPLGETRLNIASAAGTITLENGVNVASDGDRNLFIEIRDGVAAVPPRAGVWTIQLTPAAELPPPLPGAQCDAWLADFELGALGVAPAFTTDVEEAELVASPGSAVEAITAGAFVTKANWPAIDGQTYLYEGLTGIGTLVAYSAPGPLRNGIPKPDIAAPGSAIVSALSAAAALPQPFINPDGRHATFAGTSMAAAHVAGACALLLAGQPGQSVAQLKAKLTTDAASDDFTGLVPNSRWGAGKLKLVNGDTQRPLVTLLAPNGGEDFAMGSTHTVAWRAEDNVAVVSITLEYSSNDGGTYSQIAAGLANTGSFNWVVPNGPTRQARVRVRALDGAGNLGLDASDAPFFITDQEPPTVRVIEPNGGQDFPTGSVQTIAWTAGDNVGVTSVTLEYSLNGGGSYTTIAAGELNDGSFFWTLPQTPTAQALVRVRAFDTAGNTAADVSDAPFRISDLATPAADLTAPNGGESWSVGSTQTISWTASDNVAVVGILLELSTNGGGNWTTIAADEANDGAYPWVVPPTPTAGARVRVSARDAAGNTGTDASNGNFSIVDAEPPALTLTAPTGGEVWVAGETRSITWSATDNVAVASVKIEFSANDGASYVTIAPSAGNSGAFVWTVPETPTSTARVRLTATDTSGQSTARTSGAFTIQPRDQSAPNVSVTAPNGGEVWAAGSTQSITWNATDDVGVRSILLEFSANNGGTYATIIDLSGNSGSHLWTVPATATAQGRIRATARDGAGNARQDASDATFTIQVPDTEDPSVTVLTPNGGESWSVGSQQFITWSAADNVGVTSVAIEFSANGGSAWTTLVFGEPNDGSYGWIVANSPTTQAIIRITAFDAATNIATDTSNGVFTITAAPPPPITVTVNTQGSAELSGFRMATWPVVPTNPALSVTLEDDLGAPDVTQWRFGRWDPGKGAAGGYRSADGGDLTGIEIGQAYWILTRASRAIDVVGRPIEADSLSIPLPGPVGGWHQIGNPFRVAIPFDGLQYQFAGGGTAPVGQALRGWTGGPNYTVVGAGASLLPQSGYWIQKTDGGQRRLLFRRTASLASASALGGGESAAPAPGAPSFAVTLEARRADSPAGTITLGVADVTPGVWNTLSRPLPPPPPGGRRGLHLDQPEWGEMSGAYEALYLPAGDEIAAEIVPGDSAGEGPLELVWTVGELPSGWSARVVDMTTGSRSILTPARAVSLGAPPPAHRFRLVLSRVPETPPPVAHLLARPNPFTESTLLTLGAGLPVVAELLIFDAFGRLKRRLPNGGGDSEWTWDGRDDQDRAVPAGCYYVRTRSTTTGQQRTLRLVRLPRGR